MSFDGSHATLSIYNKEVAARASGAIMPVHLELALTRGGVAAIRYAAKQVLNSFTPPKEAYNLGFAKGHGKGERNRAAKPEGTDNPFKKYKPNPKNPENVQYKDVNGKTKSRPKPKGFDEYWKKKHPNK